MNISFIGAGRLAWHLAPALENAGHAINEVYSRSSKSRNALVKRLYEADAKADLDFARSAATLFVIAVPDDAIEEVANSLRFPPGATVVHTSGAAPLARLGYSPAAHKGVFYPLQTFSKEKAVDFTHIPLLVEGEDAPTQQLLSTLARDISRSVHQISSADRAVLHVGAVFACNLTNHLFTIAQNVLQAKGLSFDLLKPLIAETMSKSLEVGPKSAQTGPAVRGDLQTLDKHMELLERVPAYQEIYRLLSQDILDSY